ARQLAAEELIVVINTGTTREKVTLQVSELVSQPNQILYGDGEVAWSKQEDSSYLTLQVPPRSGCVLG
ncbi:MAG: alpha-amylase, partial [Symploca sp. SIO2D2]|nr:alpha-amylase [Symploca sp. SIO2D2]